MFSAQKANAHCRFIENLPHVEGTWETDNIVLQPAQIFVVGQLFGFRKIDGNRRFTECVMSTARKNAKTTLAAAILDSCLCLEREMGAQIISAATTGNQARIVWNAAKKMIDRRPALRATFDIETFANSIARYDTGSTFVPINSKASSQDGLNPSAVNLDEIHAHKTVDLLNVLRSAAGARRNPLWLYTTTEGYQSPGPWPELREFARRVLLGIVKADHMLAVLWMMDEDDDELDETKWVKANPLAHVNPIIFEEMSKMKIDVQNMPSRRAEFRIKRCNLPAETAKGWVNLRKWNRCAGAVDLDFLEGKPCWASLDLASTSDMNSWRLLWLVDGVWYTWGRFWVPEEQAKQRTETNRASYDGWIEDGHVQVTRGDTVDYDAIYQDIASDCARFQPKKIGYDPWNAAALVNRLVDDALPVELFVQGYKSYNPAMKECERAYVSGTLRHGGNPVLRWHVANVVPSYDTNLSIKPDRKRSADKIDGAVTLFMCFGLALASGDEGDSDGFYSAPVVAGGGTRARA